MRKSEKGAPSRRCLRPGDARSREQMSPSGIRNDVGEKLSRQRAKSGGGGWQFRRLQFAPFGFSRGRHDVTPKSAPTAADSLGHGLFTLRYARNLERSALDSRRPGVIIARLHGKFAPEPC